MRGCFPLTPALSQREKENALTVGRHFYGQLTIGGGHELFPLPLGEGQGEGE